MGMQHKPSKWLADKAKSDQQWQKVFLQHIGLQDIRVEFIYSFETGRNLMLWRGYAGQVYRHVFDIDAAHCDDDEIKAIKVKVKMSTC